MTEPKKQLSRQELYEAVWQTPISKLAPAWGTTIAAIVKTCDEMNIPRPGSGHWSMVQRGWQIERPALPPPEAGAPSTAVLGPGRKREKREPAGKAEDEPRGGRAEGGGAKGPSQRSSPG